MRLWARRALRWGIPSYLILSGLFLLGSSVLAGFLFMLSGALFFLLLVNPRGSFARLPFAHKTGARAAYAVVGGLFFFSGALAAPSSQEPQRRASAPPATPQATSAGLIPTASPTATAVLATRTPTATATEAISAAAEGELARVVQVIDGDTITVSMGGRTYRVRYVGMNTPERGQPGGTEATAVNRELVAGNTVRLEKDISETDQYGRLLRYVYVGSLFVNAELVKRGYAQTATYPPDVAHSEEFLQLERQAREAGAGLWAADEESAPQAQPSAPTWTPAPATSTPMPPTSTPLPPTPTATWTPEPAAPTPTPLPPTATLPPPTATPPAENCDRVSYPDPGVCIPPYPPDLDCGEISYRRFTVKPPDPHGFDGDDDGIGCES